MTNFPRSLFCRFIASFLSFVLIQTAPGLGVYEALAQIKTPVGTTGVTSNPGAPLQIQLALPSANTALTPNSQLGLTSALSVTNGAPSLTIPSVAVKTAVPASAPLSVVPLSFKPSALPAAAKSVSVNAAANQPAGALSPNSPAVQGLSEVGLALTPAPSAPSIEPSSLLTTLSRFFDGSSSYKGTPSVAASAEGSSPAAVPSALTPASLSAAASSDAVPPAPPSNNDEPKAPSRSRVSIGLALAGAGAAAAWYTSAWAVAVLSSFLTPFIAVPALVLAGSWTLLGALAGFAAFSLETWKGFPSDLKNSSLAAGSMTFRFWARFGLIFDSVLRGKTADTSAPTPANLFKYPVIAWLFVLAGYVMAPVAFVLGAAYRLVGTPFLAAFRGAREVIVGFLPWMARVFRFLSRFIVRIFPFMGGLIAGALRTAFFGAAAGAVILAGPIARDAFESSYKPSTLPGWFGYRLTQLAALAAVLVTGAVGAAVGLVSSPVHVVMGALELAFDWSNINAAGEAFFTRWMRSIKNDDGLQALINRGFPGAEKNLSLSARTTRVLNGAAISLLSAVALPFVSLATIARASLAAYRGVDVKNGDSSARRVDESGTQAPVASRAGFVLPAVMGALGALAAVGIAGFLVFTPIGLTGWATIAGAGLLGGAFGLSLSQPQAWTSAKGTLSEGALSGRQAYGGWLDARARVVAALRGEANPREQTLPSLFGALAALPSALLGGALTLAGAATDASWSGFMAVITQFLPAIKRFLNWALEVVKNIVPFAFGFVIGTVWGALKTAFSFAVALFYPIKTIFTREDDRDTARPSEAQIGAGLVLGLTLLAPALAVFAGAFALGLIVGLPVALTSGVALGVKWAGTGEKSEAYFENWSRRALPAALEKALKVVDFPLSGEGREMTIWRLYVRTASFLLASIPSAIALTIAGGAAYVRSLANAKLKDQPKDESDAAAKAPVEKASPAAVKLPAGKPPVWVAALTGALGLGAGVVAAVAFAPGWLAGLAGWKLWLLGAAIYAGVPVAGTAAGLAISQPVLWKNLIPSTLDHATAGFGRSLNYWTAAGKAVGLSWLYAIPGALLGAAWTVAGAGFGVVAAGAVAAYEGARQVVYEILPFLRTAFETAMKVLRRVVPFVFGLFAGLVSGVLGSAAFGALLLGRPYFKHVAADDFKHAGAVGFLGNVLLKLVALVLGVAFGLIGVVAGVLAALPYALTASASFAFRFAEIGGPVEKYFDHWTYGALRSEMQRLNQLTDRFEFPGGTAALSDGWIRMANILPATIAAAFAGTIAGWVGYFRSLGVAYKSAKSGGPIPAPVVDQEASRRWDRTWRSSKKAASSFFSWGVTGAVIGLGVMTLTSWTPLGLAGWLLVGALAGAGVLAALTLGGIIATIALFLWIDGQLR